MVADSGSAISTGGAVSAFATTTAGPVVIFVTWALERGATANSANAAVRTVNVVFMVVSLV
jgi:hypothetical protein